jgi:hypothetical protein
MTGTALVLAAITARHDRHRARPRRHHRPGMTGTALVLAAITGQP